jgi:hypothetical protein
MKKMPLMRQCDEFFLRHLRHIALVLKNLPGNNLEIALEWYLIGEVVRAYQDNKPLHSFRESMSLIEVEI